MSCWVYLNINCTLDIDFYLLQKEERVTELRHQLAERQALRARKPVSCQNQNQNHSVPPTASSAPPGYTPGSEQHSVPPSFSNNSTLYQGEGKLSRNHCHNSRLPLLYKWVRQNMKYTGCVLLSSCELTQCSSTPWVLILTLSLQPFFFFFKVKSANMCLSIVLFHLMCHHCIKININILLCINVY